MNITPINSTTYKATLKGGDKVEIGDKSASKFKSHIKLNRWDGECFIKCWMPDEPDAVLDVTEMDKKLKYKDSKKEHYFRPHDNGELGGFEWDVVLKKKPVSNVLTWNIETQGLKFYYQPALTQQEIDEGAFRPENVIGSYAIYHATRTNMHASKADAEKYKCGKAFHIYRPKVTDVNGKEIWGILNIDEQQGIMTVTIDQSWLDNAVYPVVIDPNFGYEDIGGSNIIINSATILGSKFQISEDGTADSMSAYLVSYSTDNAIYAIYDTNLALVGYIKPAVIGGSTGWHSANFSNGPELSANTDYWLFAGLTTNQHNFKYDAGGTDQMCRNYTSYSYANFPPVDPFEVDVYYDRKGSIYCTYTAAAVGGIMTLNTGYWGAI